MKFHNAHLAYCTNIHPAESWEETFHVLKTHTLEVRDKVTSSNEPFAIGLRLSARAAKELLADNKLDEFKAWLEKENCYVFTINGFPYGDFHGTRVKEKVYQPDWSSVERLNYTNNLFTILSQILPDGVGGSVSTLPGSFKEFDADEHLLFTNLHACARFIEHLAIQENQDLHLGLEPEPLGHFENTAETLTFFKRFHSWAKEHKLSTNIIDQHIGINYDTCHFALEFEECQTSLDAFQSAGIRISKVHLSSALAFDPQSDHALTSIQAFDEPTYLHQVIVQFSDGSLTRFKDLPEFFISGDSDKLHIENAANGRIHFHIPLYAEPDAPLGSTQNHAEDAMDYLKKHPGFCSHFEIETYTWGVLPQELKLPIEDQIAKEYAWVLGWNSTM